MKYRIEISPRARRQLDEAVAWWAEHRSREQAKRWFEAAMRAIESLREDAERCPRSREDGILPFTIRDRVFGIGRRPTHRLVFSIENDEAVYLLAVQHLARDDLRPDDIG